MKISNDPRRSNLKSIRNLFFVFGLLFSLFVSAISVPGFTHRMSCGQAISGTSNSIETVKKVLDGNTWPEGVRENFSFMEFNVLNMVDRDDAMKMGGNGKQLASGYKYFAKPLAQLEGVSRVFKKHRPALAICVEISSVKILKEYDQEFLGSQYEEFLIEGNDARGVDIGLMLRKDLPLEVEVQSHKNLIEDKSGDLVFSRDLPAYILREKGQTKPMMIIFGTHFKSQRGSNNDPNGYNKRSLQAKATSLLIEAYEKEYPGVPILLAGDFNNDVRRAQEFNSIKEVGMEDAFNVATDSVPESRRGTHFFFPKKGRSAINQLDSIMLNAVAIARNFVKSAKVLAHIDPEGNDYPPPQSFKERETRASDHLPIMAVFDLTK